MSVEQGDIAVRPRAPARLSCLLMASKDERRKHHLIPAFYLAGFTTTGTRDGVLHVFDYERRKRYKTTPLKALRETDFYKIDLPGVDPNEIERVLAEHESVVGRAFRRSPEAADRMTGCRTCEPRPTRNGRKGWYRCTSISRLRGCGCLASARTRAGLPTNRSRGPAQCH